MLYIVSSIQNLDGDFFWLCVRGVYLQLWPITGEHDDQPIIFLGFSHVFPYICSSEKTPKTLW